MDKKRKGVVTRSVRAADNSETVLFFYRSNDSNRVTREEQKDYYRWRKEKWNDRRCVQYRVQTAIEKRK